MSSELATITRITPTKRDPLRLTLRAGGRVVATLPRDQVEALGLAVGLAWTDELARRIGPAVDCDKAWRYAVRALGRRALSRGELIDRLRRRGHEAKTAEQVVDRLTDKGWLDDAAYGRSVIQAERARKPAGARLLRHKLAAKRVPRDVAERLVDEAEKDHDPVAAARSFAEQRLRSATLQRADAQARKRRLWGQLARRGFDAHTIRQALQPLLGDDQDGPS